MDQLIFDYNPFKDIEQNRVTIWQTVDFESQLPPLMSAEDIDSHTNDNNNESSEVIECHTSGQINRLMNSFMQTFSQSIDCLDDNQVLQPIDLNEDPIHLTFASGDCQELWRLAADSQTMAQNKTQTSEKRLKKKEKKLRKNSLYLKTNLIRFPEKLWRIINECKTGAIKWSADGNSILINYYLFQMHYLTDFKHFKTKNISSFVRQLNLYGFHKLGLKTKKKTNHYPSPSPPIYVNNFVLTGNDPTLSPGLGTDVDQNEWHEFKSEHFIRDRKELLDEIKRKYPNQPNDENSGQKTEKSAKSERKALKVLNEKNRAKESKPMIKNTRKQSFEENLNSVNYTQNAVNYKQTKRQFEDNLVEIIDKSVGKVVDNKPYDPLLY